MKIVDILNWDGNHLAVALCYADEESDLVQEVAGTKLSKGSLCYLGNGDVYVLGDEWTKVGA